MRLRHSPADQCSVDPAVYAASLSTLQMRLGMHIVLPQYAETYGPVFRTFFGRIPIVVISEPDLVKEVPPCLQSAVCILARWPCTAGNAEQALYAFCLVRHSGAQWVAARAPTDRDCADAAPVHFQFHVHFAAAGVHFFMAFHGRQLMCKLGAAGVRLEVHVLPRPAVQPGPGRRQRRGGHLHHDARHAVRQVNHTEVKFCTTTFALPLVETIANGNDEEATCTMTHGMLSARYTMVKQT